MTDGKTFAEAIAVVCAARDQQVAEQRDRLSAEARALQERLDLLDRGARLDATIETLRRELARTEQDLRAATEHRDLLHQSLDKEAAALRDQLIRAIEKELADRETAVAAGDVEAARRAFASELRQRGVGEQPSAAQLAKEFHELAPIAEERRRRAHAAAAATSERLKQGPIASGAEALRRLSDRRDEILAQLVRHGALSGQLPPLARGISESDVRVINAFRTFTLEPLFADLSVESQHGLIGQDPLAALRAELSGSRQNASG